MSTQGKLWAAVLCPLALACTGTLGDETPDSNLPGTGGLGATLGADGDPRALDSGSSVLRRLNRREYNNTVRDLLGTDSRPADAFPADEISAGFDTIGQYLAFSPLHAEQMETASAQLVDELFARPAADPVRSRILSCELQPGVEATCARSILSAFARRAYRRAPTEGEIDGLMGLIDKVRGDDTYESGLKAALQAVLLSPNFIYRVERDPDHLADARPVNDDELATRLSYFLWSSMPDDELFAAADGQHLLADPSELPRQVTRMLADPKAHSLVTSFGGQWLKLGRLAKPLEVDTAIFPAYDDALRTSASEETLLFFETLLRDDLPLDALLTGGFTFADARLAKHYGLPVVTGDFERVSLDGSPRAGVLTQTSMLLGTSLPYRTSPVKRGVWVLEQMLCVEPPPPPPNVEIPPLEASPAGATLRETFEAHRADPSCAACHALMDPIGFGLENFDAIGAYRTEENGAPVDASGVYDGNAFVGANELAALIAQDPRFPTCLTEHLLTYAVGRSFHQAGGAAYAEAFAQAELAAGNGTWRSWIEGIATSEVFRTRLGETP